MGKLYYKEYDDKGRLASIGYTDGSSVVTGTVITETEYKTLLTEIKQKAELIDKLYFGEITVDDIPAKWRDEIEESVNVRIKNEGKADELDISAEEALSIIMGGAI